MSGHRLTPVSAARTSAKSAKPTNKRSLPKQSVFPTGSSPKLIGSRAIGVSQMGKKWASFVTMDKKSRYIGSFVTHDDAAWAFDCVVRFMKFERPTNFDPNLDLPGAIASTVHAKCKGCGTSSVHVCLRV